VNEAATSDTSQKIVEESVLGLEAQPSAFAFHVSTSGDPILTPGDF